VRERVAFYGSTPAYYPVLAAHRLEDLGLKLNALVRQGKWGELANAVPDDVVRLFAAVGRHDQIVAAIAERFGGLVDALLLRGDGAGAVPAALVAEIRHLPHSFGGFAPRS
jgi:hypothetical protein